MTYLGDLRVEATRDNLRTISFFVQGLAQRLELSDDVRFDIELAVEEAATNIINHAYGPDVDGEVVLHAEIIDDHLRITLKDWGNPFDPRTVSPFDIDAPVETRIKGGMGLHFIHSLMDVVERHTRTREDEANTLTLTKKVVRSNAAQTLKRASQELSALQTVSEVMTADITIEDLLNLILNKLVETISAERGTLYLIDNERGELWSKILMEDSHVLPEIRVKVGEGIAGRVAETGDILNIEDAYSHPLFNPNFDAITGFTTRSILAVPMRNPQQELIGVVQLLNKIGGPFTQPDARLLTAMASQAAIAIEHARLHEQELEAKLIARELETAKNIQQSFMPEGPPHLDGWDIAVFWKPVHNVAGDFYDFYALTDDLLALVIADVSGKGIPAALFMALTVSVLRFGMNLNLHPRDMIERANRFIISYQRSRMFATVFVGYLDLPSGSMEFISAGHNPPFLYRAKTGQMEIVDAAGVAIGVFEAAKYDEKIIVLEPDDILVLYTDGITEIINSAEEEFGEDHLADLIAENAGRSAQEIAKIITDSIHRFAGDEESFDDETLIILKRADAP
jgi:sigma-B regulation protein RsbU (phosphoserine phosphatase)